VEEWKIVFHLQMLSLLFMSLYIVSSCLFVNYINILLIKLIRNKWILFLVLDMTFRTLSGVVYLVLHSCDSFGSQ